ncbi:MAG: rRNA ((1402)-2-O)-methyltransferase [Bacteroidota bacterium]|jgi:16S rRNA (cytidine1402-2'-O)-methyltransferase
MAKLILVPTPIGNLEDITLRALRILKECDLIFAEDTRTTHKLLAHFELKKKVLAFHAHNEHRFLEKTIALISQHEQAVLVSDAGTPGISDPGFLLVRACVQAGIQVECLPGPTAFVPALVASGFPCDKFVFEGFLPHKKGRQSRIQALALETRTVVLYESPHRLRKTLEQCCEWISPDREACVVREISKHFETYHRGTFAELKAHFEQQEPRGEIVLVIKGLDD